MDVDMDAGVWANLGLEERGPAWGQESISIRQASVHINVEHGQQESKDSEVAPTTCITT